MKITQAQKQKNQSHIIACAVKVFSREGYKNATIKQIAKEAQISEPSIYNYFPNKESLVFGFFEQELTQTLNTISSLSNWNQLSFSEKVQSFLEFQLESLEKHRPFIAECFQHIFILSSIHSSAEIFHLRKILTHQMQEFMIQSQKKGEFTSSPLDHFFIGLIWDFYVGIVSYWLKDQSPSYTQTTQLIDKSLALFQEILKTNVANKFLDIVQFFIRNHLFNGIGSFHV